MGSSSIAATYRLGVSSATVRGVLAELEELGLVAQPHTSAGRIPTDQGYRTYAVEIAVPDEVTEVDRLMIRHQFGQAEGGADQWFRIAASTLAHSTHVAGLATPMRPTSASLRHVDLVSSADRLATLVAVVSDGSVRPTLLPLPEGVDQEQLTSIANRLNATLIGCTADQLEARASALAESTPLRAVTHTVMERLARVLREVDAASVEQVFSDGLLNVMEASTSRNSRASRSITMCVTARSGVDSASALARASS